MRPQTTQRHGQARSCRRAANPISVYVQGTRAVCPGRPIETCSLDVFSSIAIAHLSVQSFELEVARRGRILDVQ